MFTFERLRRSDFGLLAGWLAAPHVARWWNHDTSPDAVEDDFGGVVDGVDPSEGYVVLLDDRLHEILRLDRPGTGAADVADSADARG